VLILTRKQGEQVCIGDQVTVTVVSISPKKVKLAIAAPRASTSTAERSARRIAVEGRRREP
jgi:carbon storage regulator CsrA